MHRIRDIRRSSTFPSNWARERGGCRKELDESIPMISLEDGRVERQLLQGEDEDDFDDLFGDDELKQDVMGTFQVFFP